MSQSRAALERECRTFTRYLVRRDPSPYVVDKYCHAHAVSPAFRGSRFDERLTTLARWHPVTAFVTDAYARFFTPRGLLRKKLILILAILEITSPFFRELDRAGAGGRTLEALGVALRLLLFVAAFLAGTIALLPVHFVTSRTDRKQR